MRRGDWVFQVIKQPIVRGFCPEVCLLGRRDFAALSVSHIPVREAFNSLEAQARRIYPNRGAVVTKLSKEEIAKHYDTRIMLELGAIRAALPI